MSTLLFITICFLVSAVLQGVGFFIYSKVYKKSFLKAALQSELATAKVYTLQSKKADNDEQEKSVGINQHHNKVVNANQLSIVKRGMPGFNLYKFPDKTQSSLAVEN